MTRPSRPLVSVIIPCWNAEDCIGEAIESALGQTYSTVEVIVIDDGSTDGSLEVVSSFGDRIRWETGPNRGAPAARNRALELAQGDLIQFLDADDMLQAKKLERMVPIALVKGPGVSPICDWITNPEDQAEAPIRSRLENLLQEDPVLFCLRSPIQTPSPVHWKENLIAVGGFDEKLPCSQERDLHLRLACSGIRFAHVPEALVNIRLRRNSLSADYIRVLDQHLYVFQKTHSLLKRAGRLTPSRQKALAEALARDARHYVRRGHLADAQRYFAAAAQVDRGKGLGSFGRRPSRLMARLIGPVQTELLIQKAVRLSNSRFS